MSSFMDPLDNDEIGEGRFILGHLDKRYSGEKKALNAREGEKNEMDHPCACKSRPGCLSLAH